MVSIYIFIKRIDKKKQDFDLGKSHGINKVFYTMLTTR